MISKYTSNNFGYPDNVLVELRTFTAFFKIAAVEICFMVNSVQFSSVHSLSRVQLFVTP